MRVGVIIGRIGGEDGVALETEKWIEVLHRIGHEVRVLTGLLEGDVADVSLLPPLSFAHPDTEREQATAFFGGPGEPDAFVGWLEDRAAALAAGIEDWLQAERIDALLIENASALPCHLRMGMAVQQVCQRTGIPTVTHDHDFAWERGDRYTTPHAGVQAIVERCFPLLLPNVRHAVINTAARDALEARFDTPSRVVPNVMDFAAGFAVRDEFNAGLRADLGVADDDILLFQITRIVRRKGIETAIELVDALGDPAVKLVITGTARDDDSGYHEELAARVAARGLGDRVLFAGARFDNQRRVDPDGAQVYSLSDAYAHATACTYFSTYEGFGNAFVEAVLARRPIFVNDYEPVFTPDIGVHGFDVVLIRDGQLTDSAVDEVRAVLSDAARQRAIADHNFAIGAQHFSYERLAELLTPLFPPEPR
jgi:mannosylglucosylglycerate synthase